MNAIRKFCGLISNALPALEIQVLLFPIFVIGLASASFFFGGSCQAWQWWVALVCALVAPRSARCTWRNIGTAVVLFSLFILFTYWVVFISIDLMSTDIGGYHLPAINMLIDGWNPITCSRPELIKSTLGIEPWDMRCLHVLFIQKATWIFNAVAFRAVYGDPLCQTLPIVCFVFFGAVLTILNSLKNIHLAYRLLFACLLWQFSFDAYVAVDSVIGISGIVLLVMMNRTLRQQKFDGFHLIVYSFWMMNSKASGLSSCFCFWAVFGLALVIQGRKMIVRQIKRLCVAGGVLVALLMLVSASPFYTSYRDYGHPLYPFATSNAEQYPVRDLTGDFKVMNDDARNMDLFASFVNAYVSPKLARLYCQIKSGRKDYDPVSFGWKRYGVDDRTPCSLNNRVKIWCTFALLFVLPFGGVCAVQMLLALVLIPPPIYGYLRYMPWLHGLWIFPFVWLLHLFGKNKFCLVGCAVFFLFCIGKILLYLPLASSLRIDDKLALCQMQPDKIYCNKFVVQPNMVLPKNRAEYFYNWAADSSREFINFMKYRQRRLSNLKGVEIVPLQPEEMSEYCPTELCFFVKNSSVLPRLQISGLSGSKFIAYPKYVFYMWCREAVRLWKLLHNS